MSRTCIQSFRTIGDIRLFRPVFSRGHGHKWLGMHNCSWRSTTISTKKLTKQRQFHIIRKNVSYNLAMKKSQIKVTRNHFLLQYNSIMIDYTVSSGIIITGVIFFTIQSSVVKITKKKSLILAIYVLTDRRPPTHLQWSHSNRRNNGFGYNIPPTKKKVRGTIKKNIATRQRILMPRNSYPQSMLQVCSHNIASE